MSDNFFENENVSKENTNNDNTNEENTEQIKATTQFKHVKYELEKLLNKLNENIFEEKEKQKLLRIFELLSLDNLSQSNVTYLSTIINLLINLLETQALFHYNEYFYSTFLTLFRKTVTLSVETKLLVFKHIRHLKSLDIIFYDLLSVYNYIDGSTVKSSNASNNLSNNVSNTTLRNYLLHKIIDKLLQSYDNSENNLNLTNAQIVSQLTNICVHMDTFNISSFTKYLSTTDILFTFNMFYVYYWLNKIDVDLLQITNSKEMGEIEDGVVVKIFENMWRYGDIVSENVSKNENIKSEKDLNSILTSLFNTPNLTNILYSTYIRLFYYVLLRHKRILAHCKLLRCVDKNTQHNIYSKVKEHSDIFMNIFKQINVKYIVVEVEKHNNNDKIVEILLDTNIILNNNNLYKIIQQYINNIIHSNININNTIFVKYFTVICEIFTNELDEYSRGIFKKALSKQKNIKCDVIIKHNSITIFGNVLTSNITNILYFISYNCAIFNIDSIELLSILLDNPNILNSKSNYLYAKYILVIVENIINGSNTVIVEKVLNLLNKYIMYKEHIKRIGRIFVKCNRSNSITYAKSNSNYYYVLMGSMGRITEKELSEILKDNSNSNDSIANNFNLLFGVLLQLSFDNLSNSALLINLLNNLIKPILLSNNSTLIYLTLENVFMDGRNNTTDLFIRSNMKIFCELYMDYHTLMSNIFMYCLHDKVCIPNTIVEYIIINKKYDYIYRTYYDTCMNSIFSSMSIVYEGVRRRILNNKEHKDIEDENINNSRNGLENNSILEIIDKYTKDFYLISHLYNINPSKTLKYLSNNIYIVEDRLYVFILIKQLRHIEKKDKEKIVEIIDRHIVGEEIREYMHKIVREYRKGSRVEIGVERILKD